MRFFITTALTACILSGQAHASIIPINDYEQALPPGAQATVLVQSTASNQPMLAYQPDKMVLPASTQKVFTALAALLELGPDFRFNTTVGTSAAIQEGAVNGDLVVKFTGDPRLTRDQVRNLALQLSKQNIRSVSGNLVIDTSVFGSHDKAPGWSWNDLTQCFNALPAAASIDGNCFYAVLNSAPTLGDLATASVASRYPVTVESEVRTVNRKMPEARYCELDVEPKDNNRYVLTGCLVQQKEPFGLSFSVQDPANYAAGIVRQELTRAGITISGENKISRTPVTMDNILAENVSKPASALLKTMLKESDNQIADVMFRTVGQHYYGVPGTFRSGSNAVRAILSSKAGVRFGNTLMADGSGLSRHNLVSAQTMMDALQYIARHDAELGMIAMLPVSGTDGTLRYRASVRDTPLKGQVHAKTGALQGVYNLAGFMRNARGEQVAFVQFVSGYSAEDHRTRRAGLNKFESQLYKAIYNN